MNVFRNFCIFIMLQIGYVGFAIAECNECQSNQAACINSTSFYLCFGEDTPNTDVLYHCKDGFECTNLNAICVQSSSSRPPSCGDTSWCGLCNANRNYIFACQSRTTFQMCYGAIRPTGQIGYCPHGYICDATSDNICVSETDNPKVTCDITDGDTETTSSTTAIATTSTTISTTTKGILTPNEICEIMNEPGIYPTEPNDSFCKKYIYCHYSNYILTGAEYICSGNSYFDIVNKMCTLNKPTHCK